MDCDILSKARPSRGAREDPMAEKLDSGAHFPDLRLKLAGGGDLELPAGIETPYQVVLFYRGHW